MLILVKFQQCYYKKSEVNIKLVNRNNLLHALYLMSTCMIYDKNFWHVTTGVIQIINFATELHEF